MQHIIRGEEIGDNTIYVCGFDYLQEDVAKTVTTQLTLEKANEKDKYYVGDTVEYHAFLKQIDEMTNQSKMYSDKYILT